MALRGVISHWKTRKLARLLGIKPCFAVGVMECLWHITAQQVPNGAIGRLSNEDIADQLDWDGDADALVESILDAGFLDPHPLHRLIVHNWHQRSDDTVDAALYRKGERYANGCIPRGTKLGAKERARYEHMWAAPPEHLFVRQPEPQAVAESEEITEVQDVERFVPDNVIVFGVREKAALFSAEQRLPEPEPVPVPVRERGGNAGALDAAPDLEASRPEAAPPPPKLQPVALEIACAHPWALERHLRPPEISAEDRVAVVAAIREEATHAGVSVEAAGHALLAFTRSYAQAVAQWPPGDRRFVLPIAKFFQTREYRKDPSTWRRDGRHDGKPAQPAARSGDRARTAAEQRHRDNLAKVLGAFADVVGAADDAGTPWTPDGQLQQPVAPGRVGRDDPRTVDGDRSAAWARRPA